jgi:hypothetical protein
VFRGGELQLSFLLLFILFELNNKINTVRPRKRFSKWFKQADNDDLDAIKEYYGYSNSKALQALSVLSKNELEIIKTTLNKGGSK